MKQNYQDSEITNTFFIFDLSMFPDGVTVDQLNHILQEVIKGRKHKIYHADSRLMVKIEK